MTRAQSGYSLKRTFEETPMGHFSSSPGAIYPALKRMEKAGWIRGETDNPESRRTRRVYALTPEGRAMLKDLFNSPLGRDDIVHNMDIVLLRFAFMTPLVGRERTITFIEDLSKLLQAHVAELEAQSVVFASAPLEGVLALRQGLESYRTDLRWARAALAELKKTNNR
jgi:DNA-binding PadR family transcriptional regulator